MVMGGCFFRAYGIGISWGYYHWSRASAHTVSTGGFYCLWALCTFLGPQISTQAEEQRNSLKKQDEPSQHWESGKCENIALALGWVSQTWGLFPRKGSARKRDEKKSKQEQRKTKWEDYSKTKQMSHFQTWPPGKIRRIGKGLYPQLVFRTCKWKWIMKRKVKLYKWF